MGLLWQISFLSVFFIASTRASDFEKFIQCHSNVTESGFQRGERCSVRFLMLDSCTVTAPAFFGAEHPPVEKKTKNLGQKGPECMIHGNEFYCYCEEDRCNKNATIIWETFVNAAHLHRNKDCKDDIGVSLYAEISKWNLVEPIKRREDTKANANVKCYNSLTETEENGRFCSAEFNLMPGTCYINGKGALKAENNTQEICEKYANKVKITCSTDGCNNNLEALKEAIAEGLTVSVGGVADANCKRQLTIYIAKAIEIFQTTTTSYPVITTTTIPVKICIGKELSPKAVAFVFDASQITLNATNNQSIYAIRDFIEYASTLLGKDDVVYPIGYGGMYFKGTIKNGARCYYHNTEYTSPAETNIILNETIKRIEERYPQKTAHGWGKLYHTIVYCGFGTENVHTFFNGVDSAVNKLIVHIGTGNIVRPVVDGFDGFDYTSTTREINELKSSGVHIINVAPKWGNTKQMKEWSTNRTTDYFEVENLDKTSLNADLAKRILQSGC